MTEWDSNTGGVTLKSVLNHNAKSHVPPGAQVSVCMSLPLVYGLLEGKTA